MAAPGSVALPETGYLEDLGTRRNGIYVADFRYGSKADLKG
jgi:hypothetical protein